MVQLECSFDVMDVASAWKINAKLACEEPLFAVLCQEHTMQKYRTSKYWQQIRWQAGAHSNRLHDA